MTIKIRKDTKFTDILLNSLRRRYEERKKERIGDAPIHVSDILPSTCIRKQYYSRMFPDKDPIADESIHHFIRGEASEFAISQLANLGISQADLKFEGLVAHPDIMNDEQIVELKDTVSGKRLDITDHTFRSYLRQLLYYLAITGIENGIISIRYSTKELRWIRSDEKGEYYFRPKDAKKPSIESWSVYLPEGDLIRDLLKNEIVRRKNLLVKAIEFRNAAMLPRLVEPMKSRKCPLCPFYDMCYNIDGETAESVEMGGETDLLEISGIIDYKPFTENKE
jgi:CRISPR/Cas system-associated exonuclease Cas4 (RecB family)